MISLATYLSQVKKYKIAIINISDKEMLSSLLLHGKKISEKIIRFNKVDYYRSIGSRDGFDFISEDIWNQKYDFVLFECKSFQSKDLEMIVKADFNLVLGSMILWKKNKCLEQIKNLSRISGSDRWMYILQGENIFHKKYHVEKMPYIDNPFKLNNLNLEFFEKII